MIAMRPADASALRLGPRSTSAAATLGAAAPREPPMTAPGGKDRHRQGDSAMTGQTAATTPTVDAAIAATRAWVRTAVIGLNLCPFAKSVENRGRVRYAVSAATDGEALVADLEQEILHLTTADPESLDTTLLIHPWALANFDDYNQFLDVADALLEALGCAGVLQVASFHPRYRFAGTADDDVTNCSNRSPYPTLHLLRESSIAAAVAAFPDAATIYERNIATLRRLGREGWDALDVGAGPVRPRDGGS
jgi:hypothetical protein